MARHIVELADPHDARRVNAMRFPTRALTYVGVAAIAGGFAVVAWIWARVAGLTSVPLQVPYLASGGLAGLGLIIVGAMIINVRVKLADARERDRQIQQLADLLDQIRGHIGAAEPATDGAPNDARNHDGEPEGSQGATDDIGDAVAETSQMSKVDRPAGDRVRK